MIVKDRDSLEKESLNVEIWDVDTVIEQLKTGTSKLFVDGIFIYEIKI